jgi:hypothetical protein
MDIVFWPFLMFFVFYLYLLHLVSCLRPPNCPDCGRPLSIYQPLSTKTWRMWLKGGYLYRNCGCETTLAGEKVAPGTSPPLGWMVLFMTLLMTLLLLFGGGAVLLGFILSRANVAPSPAVASPVVAPAPLVVAPPVAEPRH